MSSLNILTTYAVIDCCKCGCLFAIPDQVNDELISSGKKFYCPNGHSQHYTESTETKLKKERDKNARLTARLDQEKAAAAALDRQRAAMKGQVTKIKKRVANGVCPCCNRTFKDLAAHMSTQHPDYVEQS